MLAHVLCYSSCLPPFPIFLLNWDELTRYILHSCGCGLQATGPSGWSPQQTTPLTPPTPHVKNETHFWQPSVRLQTVPLVSHMPLLLDITQVFEVGNRSHRSFLPMLDVQPQHWTFLPPSLRHIRKMLCVQLLAYKVSDISDTHTLTQNT